MNHEKPLAADSDKPLSEYLGLLFDAVEFDSNVPIDDRDPAEDAQEQASEVPYEETPEPEMRPVFRRVDPNAPTFSEVGNYFAAEISKAADAAMHTAARLGPKRVLALLA